MHKPWFKRRSYKHFDCPIGEGFARKVMKPKFVERHSFSPLIHYLKIVRRYKPKKHKTETKQRDIMYASHRDACVLSYYSHRLNGLLEKYYAEKGLSHCAIAYRALGRSNYDFSAEAYNFAVDHSPCVILAFDVSGFFDNLDHALLKRRLKSLLGVEELSRDWYRVFRFVTKFHFVERDELDVHPKFGSRIKRKGSRPIASAAELKAEGIKFHSNSRKVVGIPQGTPISASLSNVYMIEFDAKASAYCDSIGAMYRRYSDDILLICPLENAEEAQERIRKFISDERLELGEDKTETTEFDIDGSKEVGPKCAQYLGFTYYPGGAGLRPSSLSRQWRRMRRRFRRTEMAARSAIASGKATMVFTRDLRKKFTPIRARNFSSYARRSARAFGKGEKITAQLRRFERECQCRLKALAKLNNVCLNDSEENQESLSTSDRRDAPFRT